MAYRKDWELEADQMADMIAMGAGRVDDHLACDRSALGLHAHDATLLQPDVGDRRVGLEADAALPRLMLIARDQIGRLDVAVARAPQDRRGGAEIQARPQAAGGRDIEQFRLEPRLVRHGEQALKLGDALWQLGQPEAAGLAPARLYRGLLLQSGKCRDRPHGEPGAFDRAADLADQSRCLGAGDGAELRLALEEQYVGDAGLGELEGNAAADGTTADDDDPGVHTLPSAPTQDWPKRTFSRTAAASVTAASPSDR